MPKVAQLGQTVKVTGKVSLAAVKATNATKATATTTKTKTTVALPARAWGGVARTAIALAGADTKAATKAGEAPSTARPVARPVAPRAVGTKGVIALPGAGGKKRSIEELVVELRASDLANVKRKKAQEAAAAKFAKATKAKQAANAAAHGDGDGVPVRLGGGSWVVLRGGLVKDHGSTPQRSSGTLILQSI